jgi:uncharacterized membrane protein (DUF106 family)
MVYLPLMSKIQTPAHFSELPIAVVKSMVGLATSGFGVVVALAWNQVIQKAVADYIDPYLGKNSGMISLFIYAAVMTILAVIVTMQLTQVQRGLELIQERVMARKDAAKTAAAKAPAATLKKTTLKKSAKTTKPASRRRSR